jgi:hypothetical protein
LLALAGRERDLVVRDLDRFLDFGAGFTVCFFFGVREFERDLDGDAFALTGVGEAALDVLRREELCSCCGTETAISVFLEAREFERDLDGDAFASVGGGGVGMTTFDVL